MPKDRGTIKSWNPTKAYGFIDRTTPAGDNVFLHISNFPQGEIPGEGDTLEFNTEQKPGKKNLSAINVTVLAKAPRSGAPTLSSDLAIKQGNRIVGDTVTFVTKAGSKPCKGQVRVAVSTGFTKLVNLNDSSESSASPVVWETNTEGILNVRIVTKECYHEVKGTLANDATKTATTDVYDV